jgi:hypothetical protein
VARWNEGTYHAKPSLPDDRTEAYRQRARRLRESAAKTACAALRQDTTAITEQYEQMAELLEKSQKPRN